MKPFLGVNLIRAAMLFGLSALLMTNTVNASEILEEQHISVSSDRLHLLWIGVCTILVLFMQCGFLMLEGGMVRSKNAINVILKNFTDIGLGSVGFWLFGFGLMFGVNSSGWIGTSGFLPLSFENLDALNLMYQMMFAATAATIVSGAVAERFSFLPYILAAFVITTVIYPIFGSWIWNDGGWLKELGFHDAAGATVVHGIGAWCALGALLLLGPRSGRFSRKGDVHEISGHSLPYVALGGFILWFGWFGFNGGAVATDLSNLGTILFNTHLGAVGGVTGAIALLAITRKGFYMTAIVNGALGGLVSVTAGCDVMTAPFALLTGLVAGMIVVSSTNLLNTFKIDDVVGAVPVHGFCGAWGTLAAGLFWSGDMFNVERIIAQLVGIVACMVWGLATAYSLFWIVNKVSPIRVSTRIEQRGLDISEHKEIGYSDFMTTHVKADS